MFVDDVPRGRVFIARGGRDGCAGDVRARVDGERARDRAEASGAGGRIDARDEGGTKGTVAVPMTRPCEEAWSRMQIGSGRRRDGQRRRGSRRAMRRMVPAPRRAARGDSQSQLLSRVRREKRRARVEEADSTLRGDGGHGNAKARARRAFACTSYEASTAWTLTG